MNNVPVYIGIDPTQGARAMTCAMLNAQLEVVELFDASLDEMLQRISEHPRSVCAVDAPIGPNKGLMAEPEYRKRLGLEPDHANYATFRVCEYELRRRGLGVYNTHPNLERVAEWMKEGWQLYDKLRALGFTEHSRPGARRMFEVHPHACYTVLIGKRPYPKRSVEGRMQRQIVLHAEGLRIHDPMYSFEEWTRHRFLTGQLNMDDLYEHDALDALVAAYTAFTLDREPSHITIVGDPAEGQIVVPTGRLQDNYD